MPTLETGSLEPAMGPGSPTPTALLLSSMVCGTWGPVLQTSGGKPNWVGCGQVVVRVVPDLPLPVGGPLPPLVLILLHSPLSGRAVVGASGSAGCIRLNPGLGPFLHDAHVPA